MIKNFILGNKFLQKFWWTLYKISLKGLNYDRGHIPSVNGEGYAIKYAIKSLKKSSPFIVFDIGANRGQYLSMALTELNSVDDYMIYCFEPQKDAFGYLKNVAAGNKKVTIENIGLGSKVENKKLYKNSPQSEYGSLYKSNYTQYNVELALQEEVEISTLDNYCAEHNIKSIDFLKIDVEGHEIEVLKGAENLIANKGIRFIQFEFGLAAIESRIFMKDFFNLLNKYTIYRILPHGLERIEYSEYHELFLTTNYLSVLKTQ